MVDFNKTLRSSLNSKTVEAQHGCCEFGGFIKKRYGACDVQFAALAERSIGVVQQAVFAACIIYKYLYASEHYFARRPKGRHAAMSIAYTTRGVRYAHIFWPVA